MRFNIDFFLDLCYTIFEPERSGHMLQRKITKRIEGFYRTHPKKAMMIIGARQVGKSFIIEDYAKKHYENVDHVLNPALLRRKVCERGRDVKDFDADSHFFESL